LQEDVLRAIIQVQNILHWDSPESVSKLNGDSLKGKQYDVILYHEPPFVIWEDREGTADPVSFHVGDLHESDSMLQEERPAAACIQKGLLQACISLQTDPHC
jgi:hypothetical protein